MTEKMTYAEAVNYARKYFFAVSQTGDFSAKSTMNDGGMQARMLTLTGIRRIQNEPERIVSDAVSDPDAFDALRYGAAQLIAIGQDMSPSIRFWVTKYLHGKIERPLTGPGSKGKDGLHAEIFFMVSRLVELGLISTRNDASAPLSACDAVADAIKVLGMKPNSYDRVKVIYREMKKRQRPDGTIAFETRDKIPK